MYGKLVDYYYSNGSRACRPLFQEGAPHQEKEFPVWCMHYYIQTDLVVQRLFTAEVRLI
jgi:hypothetical protein